MRDLKEFLAEADLGEYHETLGSRLKVTTVEHLKYVKEEDLEEIGMTRPEMRRLKKFYRKEFPSGAIGKLRKAILRGNSDVGTTNSHGGSRTLSPSPPQQRPTSTPLISHPRPIGQLTIPEDALQITGPLGEGDFGIVKQGTWTTDGREKIPVAVKIIHQDMLTLDHTDILREAKPLHELDHECIIKFYGIVNNQTENTCILVNELAPMRSLLERLRDPSTRQDTGLPRLCDFAQQVCEGMAYMEARNIVHRDLAARNVLVFTHSQVKISDTGLSKMLSAGPDSPDSNFWYSSKLPVAWYAPETIKSSKFSPASDVWSFGVLLWEMFSYGRQPWGELTSSQVMEAVDEPTCERLDQPDLSTTDLYQLMCQCWQHVPQARPTFASMVVSLPQMRPTLVKALKDSADQSPDKGYIQYKGGDIIAVLDKCPSLPSVPRGLVWRGVLTSGHSGLFDPTNVVPFIETKASPVPVAKATSLTRKESNRSKPVRKIRADMISQPQNDLRHTGHIGFDGAVFGDVSFIGDAYDKLPVRLEGGLAGSRSSVLRSQESPDRNGHVKGCNSDDSLDRNKPQVGHSWLSRDSLNSQSTMQSEHDGPSYLDMEDDSLFSDFKMPDLGSSFDFGPSFMDEVLKALDEKEKQVTENGAGNASSTAPTPAKRDTTDGPMPLPRGDPPKEKKQAKVKPMSVSDEKMLDAAIARSRELTSHQLVGSSHSPPVSPGHQTSDLNGGGGDDSPGLLSKLKNSMRRSGSEEERRQRTFSEGLESKGDISDDLTPEAEQAYDMLVVKGSLKDKTSSLGLSSQPASNNHHSALSGRSRVVDPAHSNDDRSSSYRNDSVVVTSSARSQHYSNGEGSSSWAAEQMDVVKDSKRGTTPPRISNPIAISAPILQTSTMKPAGSTNISAPVPAARPNNSQQPPPVAAKPSTPPVPAPRPVIVKSEIPVPKPRPEIQRVEPTIRQNIAPHPPASPDITPKKLNDSSMTHIPVPANKDREELKRTIEIVRVGQHELGLADSGSGSLRDDLSDRAASTSFDRSSARSSQRSSLDRSDNLSETAESEHGGAHSEGSSDSSFHRRMGSDFEKGDHRGIGLSSTTSSSSSYSSRQVERKDSLTRRLGGGGSSTTAASSSLFEEDLSEPSPQEIMSKLRERRLNRHLDHQRALTGDTEAAATSTLGRNRTSVREPQGIPGRTPSVDLDDVGGTGDGNGGTADDEVDTNPLRMLRAGGAIPIRTGRASGTGRRIAKR